APLTACAAAWGVAFLDPSDPMDCGIAGHQGVEQRWHSRTHPSQHRRPHRTHPP
ncbi:unnamed protein product, partial [Closterium sp. Naga37s-1]